jgi:hypothetical protein
MSDSDRSIPPLDQHLKTIKEQWNEDRVHRTQMDKVIDWLVKGIATRLERNIRNGHGMDFSDTAESLLILEATRHRPHLPNRQRLLELVEAAMPKVSHNETAKGGD